MVVVESGVAGLIYLPSVLTAGASLVSPLSKFVLPRATRRI